MDIGLASRGETPVVTVTDGSIQSGGTAVQGGFRLSVGRTPRFDTLDLAFRPLALSELDDLLGREPTIDGLIRGTVSGSGRIDALDIAAEVSLETPGDSVPPSRLQARGGVSLVAPFSLESLELAFDGFEPRWMGVLGLAADVPGRVAGTVTLDRPAGGVLAFRGAISHTTPAGDLSALSGAGTVDSRRSRRSSTSPWTRGRLRSLRSARGSPTSISWAP